MPPKKSNLKKTTKPPKATNNVKRPYNAPKKQSKNKEFVSVPEVDEEDIVLSDEDLEFFAENEGFQQFLQSMNTKELTRNTKKPEKAKLPPLSKAKKLEGIPEPTDLSSSDEEDYDEIIVNGTKEFAASDDEDLLRDLSSDSESERDQNQQERRTSQPKKVAGSKERDNNNSDDNDDDKEMDYELQPRKIAAEWTRKDYVNKLPIKFPGGRLAQAEEETMSGDEEDTVVEATFTDSTMVEQESEDGGDDDVEDKMAEQLVEMNKPVLNKKQLILTKKEELAALASTLQEDPEENIGKLRTFRDIYNTDNVTVKKLTLLAQLAVYKDIIPGYRIRTLTEKETAVQVSKDVKKLRQYEQSLLYNYDLYLKELNKLLSKRNTEMDASMALVATRCLCELLTAKPHFNFRLEIMVSIVARMSTLQWDEMADLSYKAIINLLETDESGRTSLDAVKMITRMIKSKGYVVHEKVINIFLYLRLMDEMAPVSSTNKQDDANSKKRKAKDKPFMTKKARKAMKETKEIEKEFQEAEAVVSKEEKDKTHTETLKLVFAFYFRILKKQTSSPLLPGVLNGLAKFAHLINVDFFNDLLNALRDVMNQLEDTSLSARGGSGTRKRLLCITTAFELLSGQGEALNYDLKDFYKEIYQILFKATYRTRLEDDWAPSTVSGEDGSESEAELLLRGLEMMFLRKRQIPIDRLAAFVKRFTLVALNMPNKTVTRCLILVQRLLQRNPRLDALIQSEDRAATGIYMPLLEDPELCSPFGTSLYELFLYQNHYDPNIRALAQTIQQQSPAN